MLFQCVLLPPSSITDKIQLCEAAGSMGIQSADLFQVGLLSA
ncbi:MAG: hypothetical protein SCARUB_02342 [Candidatus Scalindua rubra]|uniref:Uncharacterized protein n=1 Tax=Candidatus Scalindua rubra TaxID=1872076 RepID=A0A1E3XA95_9BACT|nr:MAG: hypothetical protein SCARUB_02342 [Candidatus Scalindua rubra]